MGEIKISYIHDPETGRRELWVDYESANDWMPAEHERRHKEILRQLVDRGAIDPSQIDRFGVRVEGNEVVLEELDERSEQEAASQKS
ncbi:hypothetical protein L6R29_16860 [Myxococcota bacterium]|nr:hypothetical protein [Myxococcota bacterium]